MFSGFSVEEDSYPFYKFLYIMLTIIQVLVMFNLLISIVGDTRSAVISKEKIIEPQSVNSIILEMEQYMLWNRKANKKAHLVFAEYENITDASAWRDNLPKENRDVYEKVQEMDTKFTDAFKSLQANISNLQE